MQKSSIANDQRSAAETADLIRNGKITSVEVVSSLLRRIAKWNPRINAFAVLQADAALKRAEALDRMAAKGKWVGILHGVPFTIKECVDIKGMPTSLGTRKLRNNKAGKNAPVVDRILKAGGVLLGKTTLSEAFADWQCESENFGRTRNPWNLRKTTGGSSGGACAAVASGMSLFDVGSDLGGSIRNPAHFCGVYGFKPTEGRIPVAGQRDRVDSAKPAPILNALGPIARSAADLELLFPVLASCPAKRIHLDVRQLKIAYMPEFPEIGAEPDVRDAVKKTAMRLRRKGCGVELTRPDMDYEALWKLRETLRDIVTGVSKESLRKYAGERKAYIDLWEKFFKSYEFFLCPVTARTAWNLCRPYEDPWNKNGRGYPRMFYYTTLFNLTGHPALSVPSGMDRHGLPVGVQMASGLNRDEKLLAFACLMETRTPGVAS